MGVGGEIEKSRAYGGRRWEEGGKRVGIGGFRECWGG